MYYYHYNYYVYIIISINIISIITFSIIIIDIIIIISGGRSCGKCKSASRTVNIKKYCRREFGMYFKTLKNMCLLLVVDPLNTRAQHDQ